MAGKSKYIKAVYAGPPKVNGYVVGEEYEIKVMQRWDGEITVQSCKCCDKLPYMDIVRFLDNWKNVNS